MAIFSTLVLGFISDLVQRKLVLAMIYLVRGLGFIALVIVSTRWQLYTIALLGGLVWAGALSLSSAISAEIGAMIGSWLGGWAYDNWHTHYIAFGAASVLLLMAAFCSCFLPKINNH